MQLDKEIGSMFPAMYTYPMNDFENNELPQILHEPDEINGYDSENNLLIGIVTNFHNEIGVTYTWYKNEHVYLWCHFILLLESIQLACIIARYNMEIRSSICLLLRFWKSTLVLSCMSLYKYKLFAMCCEQQKFTVITFHPSCMVAD